MTGFYESPISRTFEHRAKCSNPVAPTMYKDNSRAGWRGFLICKTFRLSQSDCNSRLLFIHPLPVDGGHKIDNSCIEYGHYIVCAAGQPDAQTDFQTSYEQ